MKCLYLKNHRPKIDYIKYKKRKFVVKSHPGEVCAFTVFVHIIRKSPYKQLSYSIFFFLIYDFIDEVFTSFQISVGIFQRDTH